MVVVRATFASIDLDAIGFNLNQVKKRVAPSKVMAVVKANAYGHGAVPVAQRAIAEGVDFLGVALVEEGIELRNHGIQAPILVFGGFFKDQIPLFVEYNLQFTLYSRECLIELNEVLRHSKQRAGIHVKVDTGMGRVGIPFEQALDFVSEVAANERIELIGLYTHFSTSDEEDKSYSQLQLKRFREIVTGLESAGIHIPVKHAANSGAILDLPDSYFDMVRAGIIMYGYYPSSETSESLALKAAITLKSRVLFIKPVKPGTAISYGRKFIATTPTNIATIPLGYADGINRLLTNRGFVSIDGKTYPIVGRVCMDQIMVDVGNESGVKTGDEVVLFGPGHGENVSMEKICDLLQTIPYEVCCWVSYRVPRIYTNK